MIEIRQATDHDVTEAAELLARQLSEHEFGFSAADLLAVVQAVIADSRTGYILLAVDRGRPAGIAYVAIIPSIEHGGFVGWLEELYVLPEARERGVGSGLLSEALKRGSSLGLRGIELEVDAGHERSAGLYRRHGFQGLSRSRYRLLY